MTARGAAVMTGCGCALLFVACTSSSAVSKKSTATAERPAAVIDARPASLRVDVESARVGQAIRLDVRASSRSEQTGAPFEDPDLWIITARQGDRVLQRLVNGSVRVQRSPYGFREWDTEVRFTVVYGLRDSGRVHLHLIPPNDSAIDRVIH